MQHRDGLRVALLVFPLMLSCGGGNSSSNPLPSLGVQVTITPITVSLPVNQRVQFAARVTGSNNTAVMWSVQEQTGGTVDDGIYHAPYRNGTYHVTATSVADPTKSSVATVSVSAMFAFIQALPNGQSPWSVAPMIGRITPENDFVSTPVIDPSTGQALDTTASSVFLSPDGTKVVFAMNGCIYTINSDGTEPTQLTANTQVTYDSVPQFSPDGTQIVFVHQDIGAIQLTTMNVDGSSQRSILDSSVGYPTYPSFSPDGTKIVAVLNWVNVAVMNADGSDVVLLGPSEFFSDSACTGGEVRMPSFTSDARQIVFSRHCFQVLTPGDPNRYDIETVYVMNVDGTGLKSLYGFPTWLLVAFQPQSVGDQIVFSARRWWNLDSSTFELMGMRSDGSNVKQLTTNTLYDAFSNIWLNH